MRTLAVMSLLIMCAAPVAYAATTDAREVRIVESRNLRITAPKNASHLLQLHLYTFAGTGWRSDEVLKATAAAAQLLEQCGTAVTAFELHVIDAPERFRFYSTTVSRELMRVLAPERPAVFFVEDTRNRPAFDAETIGRSNASTRPELADTIWVTRGTRDPPVALAHELVHLLSDSGDHTDAAQNLMRDETSTTNSKLTEAQCTRLRQRGETNGLLERR